jgi:hypothetical protein
MIQCRGQPYERPTYADGEGNGEVREKKQEKNEGREPSNNKSDCKSKKRCLPPCRRSLPPRRPLTHLSLLEHSPMRALAQAPVLTLRGDGENLNPGSIRRKGKFDMVVVRVGNRAGNGSRLGNGGRGGRSGGGRGGVRVRVGTAGNDVFRDGLAVEMGCIVAADFCSIRKGKVRKGRRTKSQRGRKRGLKRRDEPLTCLPNSSRISFPPPSTNSLAISIPSSSASSTE